jgi:hypothetical protein
LLHYAIFERLERDKNSTLLWPFVSYEEKSVVNMAPGTVFAKLFTNLLRSSFGMGCLIDDVNRVIKANFV